MQDEILAYYASHSPFTEPGSLRDRFITLPEEISALCRALRGLLVHYRASDLTLQPERLQEIDTCFVAAMLQRLQELARLPLGVVRPPEKRLVGCCRDFATLLVAVLRERGVPARTRVGFATYLHPYFHADHVIAEVWNGERWVWIDPEMPPERVPFDPHDMPRSAFVTGAEAWRRFRDGEADPDMFGVAPDLPYRGNWFMRDYVLRELAALNKYELLLWASWGLMMTPFETMSAEDLALLDRASQLLRDPLEPWQAWLELFRDPRFRVPEVITLFSPAHAEPRQMHLMPLASVAPASSNK
jgi:hypothetical protein